MLWCMDTVRRLMALLQEDKVTVEEVAENFRALPRPQQPVVRVPGLAESYRRAEAMPEDNDSFWIDAAYRQRAIEYDDYKNLVQALASSQYGVEAEGVAWQSEAAETTYVQQQDG